MYFEGFLKRPVSTVAVVGLARFSSPAPCGKRAGVFFGFMRIGRLLGVLEKLPWWILLFVLASVDYLASRRIISRLLGGRILAW